MLRTAINLFPNMTPLEKQTFSLESLDEDRRTSLQNNEATKKRNKTTFDCQVNLQSFTEGDMCWPMISPTTSFNPYGEDPMSSIISLLRVPTY
jgi:hypothetical protein